MERFASTAEMPREYRRFEFLDTTGRADIGAGRRKFLRRCSAKPWVEIFGLEEPPRYVLMIVVEALGEPGRIFDPEMTVHLRGEGAPSGELTSDIQPRESS